MNRLQICETLLAEEGTYFYTGANKELKTGIQKVKTVKSGVSEQSWLCLGEYEVYSRVVKSTKQQSSCCVVLHGFNSHTDLAKCSLLFLLRLSHC